LHGAYELERPVELRIPTAAIPNSVEVLTLIEEAEECLIFFVGTSSDKKP